MDQAITRWINAPAGSSTLLDPLMIAASHFGVPLLVLLVVLQWWSKHERLRVRHTCVAAGLSFLIGLALNQIVLLFVHRVRPYDAGLTHLIIGRSSDWSFPSDHATATVAIAAAFLFHGWQRRALGFAIGALLVCVSRIYVGTHYLTDVLGGAVTGIVAAGVVRWLYWEGTWADRFVTRIL
ncbi:MAG: phosphatase PAP2 family protein [Alphaproteobacteria bacterium]|nr:phosphatase PAP2 family protein [Alphaproteobacteria bacterium]